MIKHDEAKQRLMNINIRSVTIGDLNFFTSYITEQEKKDERHAKELELLELYRMLVDKEEEYNTSDNTIKRMNLVELLMSLRLEIKVLEEEMK